MKSKVPEYLVNSVDTTLFTCEYECMLYEDVCIYPTTRITPFGPMKLIDTVEVVERLLETKKLDSMEESRKEMYKNLYKCVLWLLDDVCDWDKITLNTGDIPRIRSVIKRMKGLIDG